MAKCEWVKCANEVDTTWPISHKKYCSKRCLRRAFRRRNQNRLRAEEKQYRIDHYAAVRAREIRSHNKNIEKGRAARRNWYRRKEGITSTETKSGDCEICGKPQERLHFDHDHVTGAHRGWLCFRCNLLLGKIDRIPDWAVKIQSYLSKAKEKERIRDEENSIHAGSRSVLVPSGAGGGP